MSDRHSTLAAERAQARAVAAWLTDNYPASNLNVLEAFTLISRQFPDISLRAALLGYVFRRVLAEQRVLQ